MRSNSLFTAGAVFSLVLAIPQDADHANIEARGKYWEPYPRPDSCALQLYENWWYGIRFCETWTAGPKPTTAPKAIPDWLRKPCDRDPAYVSRACSHFLPDDGGLPQATETITETETETETITTTKGRTTTVKATASCKASTITANGSGRASTVTVSGSCKASTVTASGSGRVSTVTASASCKASTVTASGSGRVSIITAPGSCKASTVTASGSCKAPTATAPSGGSVPPVIASSCSASTITVSGSCTQSNSPPTIISSGSCSASTVTVSASSISGGSAASASGSVSTVTVSACSASSVSTVISSAPASSSSAISRLEGSRAGFGYDPYRPRAVGGGAYFGQVQRTGTAAKGDWVFEASITPGFETTSSVVLDSIDVISVTAGVQYQASFQARISNAANTCYVYSRVTDDSGLQLLSDNFFTINNDFQFQTYSINFIPFGPGVRNDLVITCQQAFLFPIVQLDELVVRRL